MTTLRDEITAEIAALEAQAKVDAAAVAAKIAGLKSHLSSGTIGAWLETEAAEVKANVEKLWDFFTHKTQPVVAPVVAPVAPVVAPVVADPTAVTPAPAVVTSTPTTPTTTS